MYLKESKEKERKKEGQDDAVTESYVWVQSHVFKRKQRKRKKKKEGQDDAVTESYVWVQSHVFKRKQRKRKKKRRSGRCSDGVLRVGTKSCI